MLNSVLVGALVAAALLLGLGGLTVRLAPSRAARRLQLHIGDLLPAAKVPVREASGSLTSRVLVPAANAAGLGVSRLLPRGLVARIQQLLVLAGPPYVLRAEGFLVIQIAISTLIALPLTMSALSSPNPSPLAVLGSVLCGVGVGFALPFVQLRGRVRRRQARIARALPGALDFLSINVEAGVGFDAALSKVVQRWRNPLTEEFGLLLVDFQIGKPRRLAWQDLARRTQVPELLTFITVMIQSEQVGVGIARLLQAQAEQMRLRRRQHAEEKANAAPIKMLLPMVFFVFPGILVVLLCPAVLRVGSTFLGGGLP